MSLRDELHQPLGREPDPKPPNPRRNGVGVFVLVVIILFLMGYWATRGQREEEVVLIPASAIKTREPPPVPASAPGIETVKSYTQPDDTTPDIIRDVMGAKDRAPSSAQIIDVAKALAHQRDQTYHPPRIGIESLVKLGAPRIALLIGGLGLEAKITESAIANLPPAVSLGFAPYGRDLPQVADKARKQGHEIWLQIPMQGLDNQKAGEHTLLSYASSRANRESLDWLMSRFSGYIGVENYLGADFTANSAALVPVLAEIARRGLLFLDDGSSAVSKVLDMAPPLNLTAARASINLDGDPQTLAQTLDRVEILARHHKVVIVVATGLPAALDQIIPWANTLADRGFALVPVSDLVKSQAGRP